MKLLTAAALLATIGATPAIAADTAIIMWNAADPLDAETATGIGSANLASSDLNGITITLSNVTRGTAPNQLTTGQINIDNTDSSAQTLKIIAGANGFFPGTTNFKLTGTIGVIAGSVDLGGQYFADGTNTLNGQVESVVGVGLNSFDSGSLTGPFSFSKNLFGSDHVGAPYGMAEELTLTLQPGASIFVQGASMTATGAIPEPRTWIMLIAGFGLMGAMAVSRRKRTPIALVG